MNGTTLLIWINIVIIAIIAIIAVKLYYRRKKAEPKEESIFPDSKSINNVFDSKKSFLSNDNDNKNKPKSLTPQPEKSSSKNNSNPIGEPVVVEVEKDTTPNYEYKSQNQVLVNYGNTVEKFQEPIKQSQMDIMTQNNTPKNEKTELKDLFTIDELIKESKRKDSEREKESQNIKKDDEELNELKESIKQRQEKKQEETLIEEIVSKDEKEETINDLISQSETKTKTEETIGELISEESEEEKAEESEETSVASQKDIDEAITAATQENDEEEITISETANITDALLNNEEKETSEDEIKEPILKTPTKVDESKKDYKFGADLDDDDVFGDNDLDYRKDLAKITNTIKGSKIFQDVRDKLTQEPETEEIEESFIRNVNEYEEEYEPIINETYGDFEAEYDEPIDYDEELRQQNTQRIFNQVEKPQEPQQPNIGAIKEKPARDNIKIKINNNEVVLKKGDEIIFNHLGETYSSQVYAINGDDISVKYRRQRIIIKPSDVKKVY